MGMRVRGISVGVRGIWTEIQKIWIIRLAIQEIKELSIAIEIT